LQKKGHHTRMFAGALLVGAALTFTSGLSLEAQQAVTTGKITQVISFGDSLSDVGTYSPFAAKYFDGGKFTTNPGAVWTQLVAAEYGATLSPAFVGGFGQPLTEAGGYGYAQGGSRVTEQPGIGHAPEGTPNAAYAAATTTPIAAQVAAYLAVHHSFQPDQLVLVNGGTNDMFYQLEQVEAGQLTPAQALLADDAAAAELAALVALIHKSGSPHIVLMNMTDWTKAPVALQNPSQLPELQAFVTSFNATLQKTLSATGVLNQIVYVDAYSFLDMVLASPSSYGFTVGTEASACNAAAQEQEAANQNLPNPEQYSDALFCSPATLVSADAPNTYVFADGQHPTSGYGAAFAHYVEQQLVAAGVHP
jgi:phospholipase/lecithinase/hemolysin